MVAVILWPAAGDLTLCWLCPANAPSTYQYWSPPGRDVVGQGGDLTILKIKCPTPEAWFYRQISTSTIGMNRGFDMYNTVAFLCPKSNAPPLGPILEVKCCQIPYQSPPLPVQGVVGPNIDRCINHPSTIPSSYDQEPHNPHINSSQNLPPPPISTQTALSMQPASEIPMLVQSLRLKGIARERQVLNL